MKDTRVTGKTEAGFEFTIDVRALTDMEFLELLSEVDTNPLLLPRVCERLLGRDGKRRLYDFVRDEDGFVPSEKIEPVVTEVMRIASKSSKEVKNS